MRPRITLAPSTLMALFIHNLLFCLEPVKVQPQLSIFCHFRDRVLFLSKNGLVSGAGAIACLSLWIRYPISGVILDRMSFSLALDAESVPGVSSVFQYLVLILPTSPRFTPHLPYQVRLHLQILDPTTTLSPPAIALRR